MYGIIVIPQRLRETMESTGNKTSLNRYMDFKRNALLKGPPKTQTTNMLESLLDDKQPHKKSLANKRSNAMNLSGKNRMDKRDTIRSKTIKSNGKDDEASKSVSCMWSKVKSAPIEDRSKSFHTTNKVQLQSAATLDDLLGRKSTKKSQCKFKYDSQKIELSRLKQESNKTELEDVRSNVNAQQGINHSAGSTIPESAECDSTRSLITTCRLPNIKNQQNSLKRKRSFTSYTHTISSDSNCSTLPSLIGKRSMNEENHIHSTTQSDMVEANDVETNHPKMAPLELNLTKAPVPQSSHSTGENISSIALDLNHGAIRNSNLASAQSFDKIKFTKIDESFEYKPVKKKTKVVNNDNFVRLNLRNSAGACKGARSLKAHNRMKKKRALFRQQQGDFNAEVEDDDDDNNQKSRTTFPAPSQRKPISIETVIDPLDDFLDGSFRTANNKSKQTISSDSKDASLPICPRHQRPCKLLVVKKNTGGNKGRKFYVCSLPRGEQCDFFQWEEDTTQAAQSALLNSSSTSGFITRQVAAHVDRFHSLTLPELRNEAKRRGLNTQGKKGSLLARLSIWIRDEVSKSVGSSNSTGEISEREDSVQNEHSPSDFNVSIAESEDESTNREMPSEDEYSSDSSEDELEICDESCPSEAMKVYDPKATPSADDSLQNSLVRIFGHDKFRPGQEWAVSRCIENKRSLLVAPTGQGKSLCYALPAAIKSGLCIVVSPLVSLMEDQLRHLPPSIPAATLSGQMSAKKMAMIIDDLIKNRLKILFVSPERLASSAFRRLLTPKVNSVTKQYERQLPPISLLCVDEAHCLSQWGHNFRVSYLRLRTILSRLDPESVLALTATAGPAVVRDICHVLDIDQGNVEDPLSITTDQGIKVLSCDRDNIDVAVHFSLDEEERLNILLKLLQKPKNGAELSDQSMIGCLSEGSVVVYVWRQKDAEVVSEQLRGFGVPGGIVCYHGGMDSTSRSKAQGKFMRGKARICVATVAFGLGINKADVRGVIHLCLPPSPEHFMQEIGRAGRDGKPAKAVALILVNEAQHKFSLSYSDRISEEQVRTVLNIIAHLTTECMMLAVPWESSLKASRVDIALPIDLMVHATDCKEETIQTILSILEESSSYCDKVLDIEGTIPDIVTITLKRRSLEELAHDEPIAKCIQDCGTPMDGSVRNNSSEFGGTASQRGFTAYSFGVIEFSVVKCSRLIGPQAEPRHIYATLRRLQMKGEIELAFSKTGKSIHIRLNTGGINLFNNHKVDDCRLETISSAICSHFQKQDFMRAARLTAMHSIMQKVANVQNIDDTEKEEIGGKSKKLQVFQELVKEYFAEENADTSPSDYVSMGVTNISNCDLSSLNILSSDVTSLILHPNLRKSYESLPFSVDFAHAQCTEYSATVLAKILHGIESPRTPVLEWYMHPLWGKWRRIEFNGLVIHIKKFLQS